MLVHTICTHVINHTMLINIYDVSIFSLTQTSKSLYKRRVWSRENKMEDIIGNILLFGQYTFFHLFNLYLYYIICIHITLFSIAVLKNKDTFKGVVQWVAACLRNILKTMLDPITNPENNLANPLSNI